MIDLASNGERLILTRNGHPIAVIIGIEWRDRVACGIRGRARAPAGSGEGGGGSFVRPVRVHVTARARDVGRALPRRAGRLRRGVRRASVQDRTAGLFLVRTSKDVAACELLQERGVLLVHEIRPLRQLM